MAELRTPEIAILGAGMSGICAGAKLKQAGIESFTIYEKAERIGGTWRENTYPGLTCDVPSRFYQFSFELNPGWSHVYSPGAEIWRYLDDVTERRGLRPHIEFGRKIESARFEDGRWRIRSADGGESSADFLISATGILHHPKMPEIEGLDSFAGAIFHSARWDHSVELAGTRIGIIGTGSTAVQITADITDKVGRLVLFQRTAQWIFPLANRRYSKLTRALLRRFPALNRLAYRASQALFEWFTWALIKPGLRRSAVGLLCRLHLRKVSDPDLRKRLTPSYEPMCKRLVVSSTFYEAIQRENAELVTGPIERIEPGGIRTADGTLHELDVLVLATGFDPHAFMRPIEMVGKGGVTLDDVWEEGPRAYRTVALPGFPNMFMLIGPHSPFGNHSLMPIAEVQSDYAIEWIRLWQQGRVAAMSPRGDATARYNEELRAALPNTVWTTGCDSWYLGKDGLPELWPWTPEHHREILARPELADFEVDGAARPGTRAGTGG